MQVPERFGHYVIVKKIGSGGMGDVYLAEDTKLDRKVALKVIQPDVAKDTERIRRFIHEAKSASALNHPNILTIFEIGESDGSHFIVSEFVDGVTLRDLVRHGTPDLIRKLDVGVQTAAALEAAHGKGIIHRDVKPENIMIRRDGLVKVLDFGLAKLGGAVQSVGPEAATLAQHDTKPGMIVGTAAYMSPEQARGQKLDPRSDLFSLGTVFYELFTGKHPFPGESAVDTISSIIKDEPTGIRSISPDLPRQLERIIDKLLRKDREVRYQNIRDLRLDLENLRDEVRFDSKGREVVPMPDPVPSKPLTEGLSRSSITSKIIQQRRFTLLHALIFGILGIGLIGGAWFAIKKLYPPPPAPGSYPTTELATWSSAAGELFTTGSFSPDGKMFAFSSTRSGSSNIWVTQTSSPHPIQITNDLASNSAPIWSPGGDEIAYFSDGARESGSSVKSPGIWRVPALGGAQPKLIASVAGATPRLRAWTNSGNIFYQQDGNLRKLEISTGKAEQVTSFDPKAVTWIGISPDEKQIANVSKSDNGSKILVSEPTGLNPVEAVTTVGEIGNVVWSVAQKHFVYELKAGGVVQIVTANDAGSPPHQLTAGEIDSYLIDCSPDGHSIAVGSAKEQSDLWRVGVTDGREAPLVRDIDAKLWPSLSPDGRRLVFQSMRNLNSGDKLLSGNVSIKEVATANDSTPARAVAENGYMPVWSPDGQKIAFLRKDGKTSALFIADPDGGGDARSIATGLPIGGYAVAPYNLVLSRVVSWSPDGSTIAYASNSSGASNLHFVAPDGRSDQLLTGNSDPKTIYLCPFWSNDAAQLAFLVQTQGDKPIRSLHLIERASQKDQVVYTTEKPVRLLGFGEDGKSLTFVEGEREFSGTSQAATIRLVSPGRDPIDVVRIPNAYYYNIFLSDDQKMVGYAARENGLDDIWVVPAAGGVPRKLTANNDSAQFMSRLAWSHDGKAIVFGKQTRFSLLSMITGIDQ